MSAPSYAAEPLSLRKSAQDGDDRWVLRCPECGGSAFSAGADLLCPSEGRRFSGHDGILCLMRAERILALAPFLEAYRTVRRKEGWGGGDGYYRGLPFRSEGRHESVWKIRSRSYRCALRAIERHFPDAKRADEWERTALRVVELGAGNGWFSFRMAERGHYVLSTDVSLDLEDGLGALARYARTAASFRERITRARMEMEEIPLADAQVDLVVAGAALHYAHDPARALAEAYRILRSGGLLLVLDSPVYPDLDSGRLMVERRVTQHQEQLGVRSSSETAGYFVERELVSSLENVGFRVSIHRPSEGLGRALERRYRRWRHLSKPARFPVFVAGKGPLRARKHESLKA